MYIIADIHCIKQIFVKHKMFRKAASYDDKLPTGYETYMDICDSEATIHKLGNENFPEEKEMGLLWDPNHWSFITFQDLCSSSSDKTVSKN